MLLTLQARYLTRELLPLANLAHLSLPQRLAKSDQQFNLVSSKLCWSSWSCWALYLALKRSYCCAFRALGCSLLVLALQKHGQNLVTFLCCNHRAMVKIVPSSRLFPCFVQPSLHPLWQPGGTSLSHQKKLLYFPITQIVTCCQVSSQENFYMQATYRFRKCCSLCYLCPPPAGVVTFFSIDLVFPASICSSMLLFADVTLVCFLSLASLSSPLPSCPLYCLPLLSSFDDPVHHHFIFSCAPFVLPTQAIFLLSVHPGKNQWSKMHSKKKSVSHNDQDAVGQPMT